MMGDSDDDDRDYEAGMNITGFLFGNIDENGQLEDDILDNDAKQHLASLGRLGLGSFLDEMISHDSNDEKSKENNEVTVKNENENDRDDIDYQNKSPTAEDFSEINELADEIGEENVEINGKIKTEKDCSDYDADDEENVNKLDKQLMPPPPVPEERESLTPEEAEAARQRRLETPLASMLPSKYANIDVTEIFPDFRPNKVLRFSRLFGPGKPSSLPQIWRGVRRRRKKKRHHDTRDSDSGSDQDERRLKFKGWKMNYGQEAPPEVIASDDEAKLLRPMEDKEQGGKAGESGDNGDMEPKVADWRFGPAQIWYDMLEVPETGDGFNYGFKISEKKNYPSNGTERPQDEDEAFADDAFLMVSQLHWEDDVIWNGDEIKHKVMQKLNSKNNLAGWVPSSGNRTAQAFSQPGKGTSVPVASNVRLATSQISTPLHMQSQKNNRIGLYMIFHIHEFQHAEEMKRRTLLLKVPKEAVSAKKRRRATGDDHCDYLKKHQRPANRRRTDPVVVMSTILESILNEMRDLPDVQPFLFPVSAKAVPDYYKIIQRPMDLQTIRENLRQKKYQSREEFLADVNQIVENSNLYNGSKSSLTVAAKRMLDMCVERLGEKEDRLMRLEKAINPLLDDNDQVALTFILDNVVNSKLKTMAEAWPFLRPVNKKLVKDYYNVIKRPMDLEAISKKVSAHKYHSRHEFVRDVEQILENCVQYNGKDSTYTMKAEVLVKICKETLDEYDDHLTQLENNISLVQQRAMEQADMDSSWLGPEEENYTIAEPEYRSSQTNSPDNPFGKSSIDDFDFVDVEGDIEAELNARTAHAKKKDVLEEDLQ
ncbi:transcription initiation factor TFIID subunit 1, partial [Fopius arisanus]|uniref:Transcription initiation factor TFIID subunit 1 n=1 Tax=Fopius arisanus TaxID=64838 RepID=A0A9R1TMF1_9HYME